MDIKKYIFNFKALIWVFVTTLFLLAGSSLAQAVNVDPSNISGSPGETVTLEITIDEAVANMSDWGVDIYFDTEILEYSSVDKTSTLSSPLIVSGIARSFGARVGAYSTGETSTGSAGTLINVNLNVKAAAYKNSTIQLTNFADYILGASTTNSTFTISGVTTTVTVTPSSTTDVVAGQAQTLTAEVLVNSSHLDLTDVADVTFASSGNGSFGTKSVDGSGNVQVAYTTHTTVESATITVTETLTGNTNTGTATVASIAGSPDAGTSTVAASPTSNVTVTNDGSEYATVTVTIKDANDNAVSGQTVNITLSGTGNYINGTSYSVPVDLGTATNASGVVTFQLSSTKAEAKTITAKVGSTTITQTASVTFVAAAFNVGNSTVSASPTSQTTDGGATSTLTVTLADAFGNFVSGQTVTLEATGTGNTIVQPASATNESGQTTGTIASTKAEAKTVTAKVGQTAITQTATVTFTPGTATTMTLAASKTTIASDTKGSATLTATIKDQNDNVVTTDNSTTVNFVLTDATYLALSGASATASSGVATVTVTSKSGTVPSPPATSGVNITSGSLTPPTATPDVTLTIVNFSIDVAGSQTSLVRSPLTPNSVLLTGQGATSGNYSWTLTGVGSFSSSSSVTSSTADSVTFYAPTSITGGSQTATVTLTDVTDGSLTDQATLTVYNPTQLVITSTALNQAAGASGTVTVQVQDASGTAVTAGAFTVSLSSNGTGTNYFYTTGTTTGITQVAIADGAGSATFDYNDEKTGTPTITASVTGLTSATQQETITPAAANKMTLSATRTTLPSDTKGSATLTATIYDQYNNVITTDSSTVVNFVLTDSTYLTLSGASATASSGVATVTVTTKSGTVPSPPATSGVNITSGSLTPPTASPDVTLTIVNFSVGVDSPGTPFYDTSTGVHLVTGGSTPSTAAFSGQGGSTGNYRWALTGVGTIDSTTADTINYTAPSSITGSSQTVTLTLTDASDGNLTDSISITVYNPLAVTWPTGTAGIALGDTSKTAAASGGPGTYKFQSTATGKATINTDTGVITPVAAGTFTVQIRDASYGVFGTTNGFHAVTSTIEIVNPIVIGSKPSDDALDSGEAHTFSATGGKTSGEVNWEASAGSIDSTGAFTAPTVATTHQTVTITAYDKTYHKSHSTPVMTTYTVMVYAGMQITQTPSGYVDGTPSTYPILVLGELTTLSASDTNRSYSWTMKNWNGNVVGFQITGAATFDIDPDALFAADGAGTYTITITDQNNPGLTETTLKVRVPMKLVATKFATATIKDAGTYYDNQGTDTFTITGGPTGSDYEYSALDLNGVAVTSVNCGAFVDTSPTNSDNVFTFTSGIPSLKSFRVKVTLDSTSADTDVQRLIDSDLDVLWSGIFVVVPKVTFDGFVVEDDEVTPVSGATVTATHDALKTDTTAGDGSFSITGFDQTGVTYKFVVSKTGYVDKVVTGSAISAGDIVLEGLGSGSGTISGTIYLSDNPAPPLVAPGPVSVKVKAAGQYLVDSLGNTVTVYANPIGDPYTFPYTFPVSATYASDGPFTVEFRKNGYIFGEFIDGATEGILTGVALDASNADITLNPVTIVSVTGTPQDADVDGANDQVLVKITAEAGLTPEEFDGTTTEIRVLDSGGNDLVSSLDVFASEGAKTWSFTHSAYENFSITLYADVSEDRDEDAGYAAMKVWSYVKSATVPDETDIVDPKTTGGTATSTSGDSEVTLPPGGMTGEILDVCTIAIVEADASDAGATQITGSEIVEVVMTDENGEEADNDDIQRIEITIKFDQTVVIPGSLEAGTYVIYQADSLADMVAGNATAVPTSQIIQPVDYTNGYVTFWVNHLSSFGVGGAVSAVSGVSGGSTAVAGGSGGGCFIETTSNGIANPTILILLLIFVVLVGCSLTVLRRSKGVVDKH